MLQTSYSLEEFEFERSGENHNVIHFSDRNGNV